MSLTHHPGPGPSVVLVHGAGGNAATWLSVLEAWAWADVWCVDLPGRGQETRPALASVMALADWLAQALARQPLRAPIVVGHSLGGAITQALALHEPGRYRAVLVSSGARLRVAPTILAKAALATDSVPFALDWVFRADAPAERVAAYLAAAARTPAATTVADWRACDGFDLRPRLAEIRDPVAVIYGTADALTPEARQIWLAEALGVEARAIEGAGHMVPWERPAALAAEVQRFAAQTAPPSERGVATGRPTAERSLARA